MGDLKSGHHSFAEAFGAFESTMSEEVRNRIENIQSYYECEWSSLLADVEGYSLFNGLQFILTNAQYIIFIIMEVRNGQHLDKWGQDCPAG